MTEAQKRATAAWKARHNLKRVELLVPVDILTSVDEAATEQGISRSKFILKAVQDALGNAQPTDQNRLASIEAKLDSLLEMGKSHPVDIPVETKPKAEPNPKLVALVQDYKSKGMPWGEIAKILNKRDLLSPRGKNWNHRTLAAYCQRNGIAVAPT